MLFDAMNRFFPAKRGAGLLLAAAALLSLSACGNSDDPTTDGVAAPTPYALVLPSQYPANPAQPADNPLTNEGVELGRHLFYETALSVDNSISCSSCHQQNKAFTDGLAHAVGVNGAQHARSSMSLANMLWEDKFTWDGSSSSLEAQARTPLTNPIEMHQSLAASVVKLQAIPKYQPLFEKAFGRNSITEGNMLKALSQFERTLISANSRFDKHAANPTVFSADEEAGYQLFITHPDGNRVRGGNCGDCHGGTLFTNREFSNNGLDATFTDLGLATVTGLPTDRGKFRIPSLRNIALTAPYMHDGRFKTLDEVLDHYNDHLVYTSPNLDPLITAAQNNRFVLGLGLTVNEKRQIVAFLKTLTDSTFIQNPKFAKPTN